MTKQTVLFLFTLCLSAGAGAAAPQTPFRYTSASQIRQTGAPVPVFKSAAHDRMDKNHLLVQGGKDTLLGYAKTGDEYKEAVAYWTGILSAAGLQVGTPSLKGGMYLIPYVSPDGKNVRRFIGDHKQFKPKDEVSIRANMAAVSDSLGAAGLSILTSNMLDLEFMHPTYVVYYLTDKKETRERETQIRILARGTDIDWDIVEGAVNIIQKPKSWMMVYIGREVGQVTRIAKTQEAIVKKLAEQTQWLIEQGNTMIGSKIHMIAEEDQWDGYRYASVAYFFR